MSTGPARKPVRRDDRVRGRITHSYPLPAVRSGSVLVRAGGRLLTIQDDAYKAIWVDSTSRKTTEWRLPLRGGGAALGDGMRPDFEAAFAQDDCVWVLGSGSTPTRCGILRVALVGGRADLYNAAVLYAEIERQLGCLPEIDGAALQGDRVRLFHRARRGSASFTIDVSLVGFPAESQVLRIDAYDLGSIGSAPFGFTSALALDPGLVVFTAVAQAKEEGEVAGASIGLLAGDGVRMGPLLEKDGKPCRRQVEGIVMHDSLRSGWLITDPIDSSRPSDLCWVELDLTI